MLPRVLLIVDKVYSAEFIRSSERSEFELLEMRGSLKRLLGTLRSYSKCILVSPPRFLLEFLESDYSLQGDSRVASLCVEEQPLPDSDRVDLISLGCRGFISSTASVEEFWRALETADRGEIWAPRHLVAKAVQRLRTHAVPKFTAREQEILTLRAANLSNAEISQKLGISRDTVKWHLRSIHLKIRSYRT
jgi:DNA-binding CsgD family transcriptional regulator